MNMTHDQSSSLLAAAIRMYGKDDHLIISREVFESMPACMGIQVMPMGDDNAHIVLHVVEATDVVAPPVRTTKPRHLTLVK